MFQWAQPKLVCAKCQTQLCQLPPDDGEGSPEPNHLEVDGGCGAGHWHLSVAAEPPRLESWLCAGTLCTAICGARILPNLSLSSEVHLLAPNARLLAPKT